MSILIRTTNLWSNINRLNNLSFINSSFEKYAKEPAWFLAAELVGLKLGKLAPTLVQPVPAPNE